MRRIVLFVGICIITSMLISSSDQTIVTNLAGSNHLHNSKALDIKNSVACRVAAPITTPGDDLGNFRLDLMRNFPNVFAGLSFAPSGDLVVLETTHDTKFESYAKRLYLSLPITRRLPPNSRVLDFELTQYPLSYLYCLENEIQNQMSTDPTLKAYNVVGAGLNEGLDTVLVFVLRDPPSKLDKIINVLDQKYHTQAISVLDLQSLPVLY
jgi:hypothetical protein